MIEMVSLEAVAKELRTTSRKVISAMKNGTLPIGMVADPDDDDGRHVVKIFKNRWERYKEGSL